MASKIQIFSGAFGIVTGGSIETIDPANEDYDEAAGILNNIYPHVYAAALVIRQWPWSIRRRPLTEVDMVGNNFNYPNVYNLPALAELEGIDTRPGRISQGIIALYEDENASNPTNEPWEVQDNKLSTTLTGSPEASYQFAPTEEKLPAQFVEYLRLMLASEIAFAVAADLNLARDLRSRAEALLSSLGSEAARTANNITNLFRLPGPFTRSHLGYNSFISGYRRRGY